jgi:hypothetical protein
MDLDFIALFDWTFEQALHPCPELVWDWVLNTDLFAYFLDSLSLVDFDVPSRIHYFEVDA